MILSRCIEKHRDINGKIQGYTLQDLYGNTLYFEPIKLKQAIISKQITVSNLTLTRDYRLVEKQDETFKSKGIGNSLRNGTYNSEAEVQIRVNDIERVIKKILTKYLPDMNINDIKLEWHTGDLDYIENDGAQFGFGLPVWLYGTDEAKFYTIIYYTIRKDSSDYISIDTARVKKNGGGTGVNPCVDSEDLQVKLKTTKITEDIIQRLIWAYLANIKEGIYEGAFKTKYTINI